MESSRGALILFHHVLCMRSVGSLCVSNWQYRRMERNGRGIRWNYFSTQKVRSVLKFHLEMRGSAMSWQWLIGKSVKSVNKWGITTTNAFKCCCSCTVSFSIYMALCIPNGFYGSMCCVLPASMLSAAYSSMRQINNARYSFPWLIPHTRMYFSDLAISHGA